MANNVDKPMPPALVSFSHEDQERFCLMTVDGGLSDEEALRYLGVYQNRDGRSLELDM